MGFVKFGCNSEHWQRVQRSFEPAIMSLTFLTLGAELNCQIDSVSYNVSIFLSDLDAIRKKRKCNM